LKEIHLTKRLKEFVK